MATKVKGDKIKEGSIPLNALSTEVKDKIENAGGGADWNAQEGEAGHIKNKPFGCNIKNWKKLSDFEYSVIGDDEFRRYVFNIGSLFEDSLFVKYYNYVAKSSLDTDGKYITNITDLTVPNKWSTPSKKSYHFNVLYDGYLCNNNTIHIYQNDNYENFIEIKSYLLSDCPSDYINILNVISNQIEIWSYNYEEEYFESKEYYRNTLINEINDIFIPNTIARTSQIKTPFQIYKDNGGKLFTNESAYYKYLVASVDFTGYSSVSVPSYKDINNNVWYYWNDNSISNGINLTMQHFISLMQHTHTNMSHIEVNGESYYCEFTDGTPTITDGEWREYIVSAGGDYTGMLHINPNNKTFKINIYE